MAWKKITLPKSGWPIIMILLFINHNVVSQHLPAHKGSTKLLKEASLRFEVQPDPHAETSVIRTRNASSKAFCSLVFRGWPGWPWTWVFCIRGGWGQTNLSPWAHPSLCPDKIKPRRHVSLLLASPVPYFCQGRLTRACRSVFHFPSAKKNQVSLSTIRKCRQYAWT